VNTLEVTWRIAHAAARPGYSWTRSRWC